MREHHYHHKIKFRLLGLALLLAATTLLTFLPNNVSATIGSTITLSPNAGPVAGGGSLSIAGTNFGTRTGVANGGSVSSNGVVNRPYPICTLGNDNKVYCASITNSFGQLGNGSTSGSGIWTPTSAGDIPTGATITDVASGYTSACALANGWVYCWGDNTNGQIGQGDINAATNKLVPTAIVRGAIPTGVTITSIRSGNYTVCVIGSDNHMYCWGQGLAGNLGNGVAASSGSPVAVSQGQLPANYTIKQLDVGWGVTCAIANDDRAYCWGGNTYGTIGNGTTTPTQQTTPSRVLTQSDSANSDIPAGVTFLKVISGSQNASCAIASNHLAYCWGDNVSGALGNNSAMGTDTAQPYPKAVLRGGLSAIPATATFVDIASGRNAVCAILSDNNVYCWGQNDFGSLGNGLTANSAVPVQFDLSGMPSTVTPVNVTDHYAQFCVRGSDGLNYCASDHVIFPGVIVANDIADVEFDGVRCFSPYVLLPSITDTSMSSACAIPAHAPGPVNVTVTDVFGNTATAVYTYYDLPSAPQNLSAVPSAGVVSLAWDTPATDNYSAITDYVVQYSDDSGSTWNTVASCSGTSLSCDISGLSGASSYQFRVAAVNAAGQGSWSDVLDGSALFISVSSDTDTVNVDGDLSMGYMSSAVNMVNVKTNNIGGYSFTMTAANTNMVNGSGAQIPTLGSVGGLIGGTAAWGWRVGGNAENGVASSQYSDWRPAQTDSTNSGALIDETSAPNATLPTDSGTYYKILFGVAAGRPQAAGTYSTTVVYTVVAR